MVRRGEDDSSGVRNSEESPIKDRTEGEGNISSNNDGRRTKGIRSNTGRSRRDFMTDDILKVLMGGTGLAAAAGVLVSDKINGGAYDEKEGVSHLESGQGLRLEGDEGTFIIGHEPYEGQHFVFYGRMNDDWNARPVDRGEETQIDFSQYGEGLGTAEVHMTKDWGISAHLDPKDIVGDDEVYESNEGIGISTATADVSIPSGLNIEGELYGDGEGFKVTDEYDEKIRETLEGR